MTSHHVTCHVTAMSCASSLSLKRKRKEIQKKRNIKSRKIDKRERKMLVSKRSITFTLYYTTMHSIPPTYIICDYVQRSYDYLYYIM